MGPSHRLLLVLLLVVSTATGRAQGGPPFITDDPRTPGNKHWEINLGWVGNHSPGLSSYQVPDVDLNYGWGDRIQLKYEIPLAVTTDQHNTTRAGLGESFPGVKWRFFEHHTPGLAPSDKNMTFSLGTYPQVYINNPTRSVQRGIVENGPEYYLPVEATTKAGPIDFNGEIGHWFGNRRVPDRWGRGLLAGRDFNDRFELYSEVYDLQDANRVDGVPKQRSFTLDMGGRQTLDKTGHLRLLFLGGRALQTSSRNNSEPSWLAYLGVQFLLGPAEKETPGTTP